MKFHCETIVIYDDVDMPGEDAFCPSLWQGERIDSDGDYYYDRIGARWSELQLSKEYADGGRSDFRLNVYREKNRLYEPGLQEAADLERYIDYKAQGRYQYLSKIHGAENLSVASLWIMTTRVEDYREYLETVHRFLAHTGGIAANVCDFDADAFRRELLDG